MGKSVTFTLSIGYVGGKHKETFDLESDLGLIKGENYETEEELDNLLEESWKDWSANYIDGGWDIEE